MPQEFETAIALIRASGFQLGNDWEKAHDIAQNHEGERLYDALHALLHRIEGDSFNAGYWDRQAGTDLGGKGHAAELQALVELAATA